MKLIRIFITGLLASLASLCFAQSDYIVTAKGDTIRGEVVITSYDVDRIIVHVNKKKTAYTALQARTVVINGEIYKTQLFGNTYKVMKLIRPGFLSLYGYKDANQSNYDGRYMVKLNGTSMEVPNLVFKKSISKFLEDCPTVKDKLKDHELTRKNLVEIIDFYNACMDDKTKKINGVPTPVTAAPITSAPLDNLREKVAALPDFADKKNSLELINDIGTKIGNGQEIPKYMIEGLKNYLGAQAAVKADLDAFLASLGDH
jgi:hypothetical protein